MGLGQKELRGNRQIANFFKLAVKERKICSRALFSIIILVLPWLVLVRSSAQYKKNMHSLNQGNYFGTQEYHTNYSTPYADKERTFEMGIQFYNHKSNVQELVRRYKRLSLKAQNFKLRVLEDGSSDGSKDLWIKYICCNWTIAHTENLHEIRSYDKAIRNSSSVYFITLQDDDLPPTQPSWIFNIYQLFQKDEKLAMIGMWCGFIGSSYFGNIKGSCRPKRRSARISTAFSGIPFSYVSGINQGPIAIRTDLYLAVGGFNYSYSEPGKPGIHFETELSLRMWESGWRVGLINSVGWSRGVGGKGTASSPQKWLERKLANRKNLGLVKQRFPTAALKSIDGKVRSANKELKKLM